MSAHANAAIGRYGERVAARYLEEQGWRVLDRNWRCAEGEIDLVTADGACLVIVEVKTRRSGRFGEPVEAITRAKAARLRRLAARWLRENGGHFDAVRIDAIGVVIPERGGPHLDHRRQVA